MSHSKLVEPRTLPNIGSNRNLKLTGSTRDNKAKSEAATGSSGKDMAGKSGKHSPGGNRKRPKKTAADTRQSGRTKEHASGQMSELSKGSSQGSSSQHSLRSNNSTIDIRLKESSTFDIDNDKSLTFDQSETYSLDKSVSSLNIRSGKKKDLPTSQPTIKVLDSKSNVTAQKRSTVAHPSKLPSKSAGHKHKHVLNLKKIGLDDDKRTSSTTGLLMQTNSNYFGGPAGMIKLEVTSDSEFNFLARSPVLKDQPMLASGAHRSKKLYISPDALERTLYNNKLEKQCPMVQRPKINFFDMPSREADPEYRYFQGRLRRRQRERNKRTRLFINMHHNAYLNRAATIRILEKLSNLNQTHPDNVQLMPKDLISDYKHYIELPKPPMSPAHCPPPPPLKQYCPPLLFLTHKGTLEKPGWAGDAKFSKRVGKTDTSRESDGRMLNKNRTNNNPARGTLPAIGDNRRSCDAARKNVCATQDSMPVSWRILPQVTHQNDEKKQSLNGFSQRVGIGQSIPPVLMAKCKAYLHTPYIYDKVQTVEAPVKKLLFQSALPSIKESIMRFQSHPRPHLFPTPPLPTKSCTDEGPRPSTVHEEDLLTHCPDFLYDAGPTNYTARKSSSVIF